MWWRRRWWTKFHFNWFSIKVCFVLNKKIDFESLCLFSSESLSDVKEKTIFEFNPTVIYRKCHEEKKLAQKYHFNYKFVKTSTKLIEKILDGHGFEKVHPSSPHFNLLWTSSSIKPLIYKSLHSFQRVNHFPRLTFHFDSFIQRIVFVFAN